MTRILETRRLTPVTKFFRLDAPLIASSAQPGQFVMLRVREGGERIPITIADYDRAAGTITIVVQAVGATTTRVCALEAGDAHSRRRRPARPGHRSPAGRPRLRRRRRLRVGRAAVPDARTDARAATGRRRSSARAPRTCSSWPTSCGRSATTSRSAPTTARPDSRDSSPSASAQLIDGDGPGRPDYVVAIGPMAMMRAVAETTRGPKVKTLVSMDPLMVDGTGMCGGCRVIVGGQRAVRVRRRPVLRRARGGLRRRDAPQQGLRARRASARDCDAELSHSGTPVRDRAEELR